MTNSTMLLHQPVLLVETLAALKIKPGGVYLDATFGRGGHTAAILKQLGPQGRVLALDRDPAAEQCAAIRFGADPRFAFVRTVFSRLDQVIEKRGLTGQIAGVLMDLGVSSPQLDDPERGFSFSQDGPLDMRMDPDTGCSAAEWLHRVSAVELERVLTKFGEERFHRRIARDLVAARQSVSITTTAQLAAIVAAAVPACGPGKHPATRTFQAIRIAVNDELQELTTALIGIVPALAPDGRLAVLSFHSLEDRVVKRFIREQARGRELPLDLPVTGAPEGITLRLVGRAVRASAVEVAVNPRARSAVLRVAARLP